LPQQEPQSSAQVVQFSPGATQAPSPQIGHMPQSPEQLKQFSPSIASQSPSPQQEPQSEAQPAHVSIASQKPSPQTTPTGQVPQSPGQSVQVSGGVARVLQITSPHETQPTVQSFGQLTQSSPSATEQVPSPQQLPQSVVHPVHVSPVAAPQPATGSQVASPQKPQAPQSTRQLQQLSPVADSQTPSPLHDAAGPASLDASGPPGPLSTPGVPPSPGVTVKRSMREQEASGNRTVSSRKSRRMSLREVERRSVPAGGGSCQGKG
jgi:hypothetical protein